MCLLNHFSFKFWSFPRVNFEENFAFGARLKRHSLFLNFLWCPFRMGRDYGAKNVIAIAPSQSVKSQRERMVKWPTNRRRRKERRRKRYDGWPDWPILINNNSADQKYRISQWLREEGEIAGTSVKYSESFCDTTVVNCPSRSWKTWSQWRSIYRSGHVNNFLRVCDKWMDWMCQKFLWNRLLMNEWKLGGKAK